jgi:hypothetical protein
VRAAIAACGRRRVKILIEPVETRVCWTAWIADPNGDRISLHLRKDGTAGQTLTSPRSIARGAPSCL